MLISKILLNSRVLRYYLSDSGSYSQQLPLFVHVLPHTKHSRSSTQPKNMGLGIKANMDIIIMPKPMAAVLSFSGTHLTVTKKFEALPVAPMNFKPHITAKNVTNCVKQLTGHAPEMACPPSPR